MAADSDGCSITAVVTCEGNLSDPTFRRQLDCVLHKLKGILGEPLLIRKLEPWNSVRITLSIPREAALRLRQLASEGSQQLRALGILSVQVEGDQVISLRLAGPEPQEIILRTSQDGNNSSGSSQDASFSHILNTDHQAADDAVPVEKVQFRSPNVVCPPDTIVPKVPMPNTASNSVPPTTRAYSGPFPFTSMNQAIHSRDGLGTTSNYSTPPPPYPGKHPPVTISSPLLVNLLQNDGNPPKSIKMEPDTNPVSGCNGAFSQANGTTVSSTAKFTPPAPPVYNQGNQLVRAAVPRPNSAFVHKVTSTSMLRPPFSLNPSVSSSPVTTIPIPSVQPVIPHTHPNVTVPLVPNSNISQTKLVSNSSNFQSNTLFGNSTVSQTNASNRQISSSLPTSTVPKSDVLIGNVSTQSPALLPHSEKPHTSMLLSTSSSNALHSHPLPVTTVSNSPQTNTTVPSKTTPVTPVYRSCPPPYPNWEQLELTASLTDLKNDLDHLLPTLQRELASSPPLLPEELTNTGDQRNYLINPLTGVLEPQSSSESEPDEPNDVFTGLASPATISDEDTNSTTRPDTTDQSDSETRSSHGDSGKHMRLKSARNREHGRDSPGLKPTEKIKLRLKLEKSEPVSPAYKVDVSFINMQPKKASNDISGEELRVPPLHISLRGHNHVVISNKKKLKLNPSSASTKSKIRKVQELPKSRKGDSPRETTLDHEQSPVIKSGGDNVNAVVTIDQNLAKKLKKPKLGHEHREQSLLAGGHLVGNEKPLYNNSHFKEKLKERRGSDSELSRSAKKYWDSNGILPIDKKRRLSQTEQQDLESQFPMVGSTNIGTVTNLPCHKLRKDKIKVKESSKSKELNRNKSYSKNMVDKLTKQVVLPTGEIDMEAKFKQRLLEDSGKGISRPPHRTETIHKLSETNQIERSEKVTELVQTLTDSSLLKDKPPEPDKCNTPENKPDLSEKQVGRSPNSGAQGEDSGIESMDALSEKSPNQASQSPHADMQETVKPKTQVPDMLDIEAQLAKMEGLNGEDLNENKHNSQAKLEQCCGLTSALQDSLKQGTISLTAHSEPVLKEQLPQVEVSLVPIKTSSKEEDLEPLPVHVAPPLYTYSNTDKGRSSESPSLSDSDSNPSPIILKSKSLLEQLLIEIPDSQAPSSPSPATRSVRTRASSKLNSPELNSPVPPKQIRNVHTLPKRKRHESDSSNNSLEDARNKKPRKCSENAAELIKACMGVEVSKSGVKKNNKLLDESSDSDEPLIEVAGKVRKNNSNNNTSVRTKLKTATLGIMKTASVNPRRSVRTTPALNTRSKGEKVQSDAEILRRKTRSAVLEVEGKRKKDVK